MSIAEDKRRIRAEVRRARGALQPRVRAAATARILAHLQDLPELRDAGTVLLTAAVGDEVDVTELGRWLVSRGAVLAWPRVVGDLIEVAAAPADELRPGWRAVPEPVGPALPPGTLDVLVLPGVAFDAEGGRIGQGGGHLDRLLTAAPDACSVGVGFDVQLVASVPRESHDRPVDVVVTEQGVQRPGR